MAKNRYVNTAIWDDSWFTDLDALEQHLFLYFLTNPVTNILGIYEIPLRRMSYDTGMEQEKIKKIILRFNEDRKVFYERGFIVMPNWLKHQTLNPKTFVAVTKVYNALPDWLRQELMDENSAMKLNLDKLLIGYDYSIDILSHNINPNPNPNRNINSNSNSNGKAESQSYTQTGDKRGEYRTARRTIVNEKGMS